MLPAELRWACVPCARADNAKEILMFFEKTDVSGRGPGCREAGRAD
jgi:hypothetical protein